MPVKLGTGPAEFEEGLWRVDLGVVKSETLDPKELAKLGEAGDSGEYTRAEPTVETIGMVWADGRDSRTLAVDCDGEYG